MLPSEYSVEGKTVIVTGAARGIGKGIARVLAESGAKVMVLPSTVDDTPPSLEDLQRGIEFISEAVNDGGKVYIHCSAGVGRAPTMAAAYFLSQGHNLDEAIEMIRQVRPFINIMTPQLELLQQIEAGLQR